MDFCPGLLPNSRETVAEARKLHIWFYFNALKFSLHQTISSIACTDPSSPKI